MRYESAEKMVSQLPIDVGEELIIAAILFASREESFEPAAALSQASGDLDPNQNIPASVWGVMCWRGSVKGHASAMLEACDRAVAGDPENGLHYDGRSLARALTGDYPGATQDFQTYLEWAQCNGKKTPIFDRDRRKWIQNLKKGLDPFADGEFVKSLSSRF